MKRKSYIAIDLKSFYASIPPIASSSANANGCAAISLPFSALSGFEDEIERVKKESQDAANQ